MSGEPKTLTPQAMTLKEAAERVAEKSDYLLARAQDGWGLIKPTVLGWDSLGRVWDEWEDAASFALGVRVVARDEAAELRAALERIADWPDGGNLYGQANIKRFAVDTLRRLAGGESEKS